MRCGFKNGNFVLFLTAANQFPGLPTLKDSGFKHSEVQILSRQRIHALVLLGSCRVMRGALQQ